MSVIKRSNAKEAVVVEKVLGKARTINSQSITVTREDASGNVTECSGTVVITDGGTGYAKGCRYVKTNGAVASTLYINEGSTTVCDFNAMETSASSITGVTAGDGLSGGGTDGTVSLAVNVDGSTLEINTDTVRVKDAGITAAKLAAAVAGSGLTNSGTALNVVVDDSTVEINTDTVRVKDLGITTAKLAADAVDNTKLADNAVSIENIDAGAKPILITVAAGNFTTVGGDANESITAAGVLGTDTAIVVVRTPGAVARTISTVTPGVDSIAVVLSDDPSNDHVLSYIVVRAAA